MVNMDSQTHHKGERNGKSGYQRADKDGVVSDKEEGG